MPKPNPIIIQASDDEMRYLHLVERGNDDELYLVYARKNNYPSWQDFVEKALAFLDYEEDLAEIVDIYLDPHPCTEYTEASNPLRTWEIESMLLWYPGTGFKVKTIVIDNILSVKTFGPDFHEESSLIETETDYILKLFCYG